MGHDTKLCTSCSRALPLTDFYVSRGFVYAWCKECAREKAAEREKDRHARNRQTVIDAYGGKCACCAETERAFLVLDHVNGGGNFERKTKGGNRNLFAWLIKAEFPLGYQVLCCNCNHAKHFQGECPHQRNGGES